MYTIYCHLFPNGKRYVGLTKLSLNERWGNGSGYKTCPLIDRAIKKYGWENVKHEVLGTADNLHDAENMERGFIERFSSDNPMFGYNILPGGDVSVNEPSEATRIKLGNGWRGKHRSEDEKKKIGDGVRKTFERPESNGHFGMKASDATRDKMSAAHIARWSDDGAREERSKLLIDLWKQDDYRSKMMEVRKRQRHRKAGEYKASDEAKEKLSKQFKGRWIGDKSPCSKPVLQFSKDGTFIKRWANAGEAERDGIASRANISKVCRGAPHCKTAGGFIWKFDEANER